MLRKLIKTNISMCHYNYTKLIEQINLHTEHKQFRKFTKSMRNKSDYPCCMSFSNVISTNPQIISEMFANNFKSVISVDKNIRMSGYIFDISKNISLELTSRYVYK